MASQILYAAQVPGVDGYYCLGPFPRRVSFSAQQNRSLNLVWALNEEDKFKSGDTVAVIGAGLAGITAAAAFSSFGCKVDMFESGLAAMARQRGTDHRMVHPTINRWPATELSLTTELPFLDWHFGRCSAVSSTIVHQLTPIVPDSRVHTGVKVLDVMNIATGAFSLRTDPTIPGRAPYSVVLLALGFGEETPCEGFEQTDYWVPDGLESHRLTGPKTQFIVSGCGDGGLIDALRLAHEHFERGQLAFEVAAELSGSSLATSIKAVEQTARDNDSPDRLAAAYLAAAEEISSAPKWASLSEKLRKSLGRDGLVYLIDNTLSAPFSLYSAPIHKLLVAHAMLNGRIVFKKGEVERKKPGSTIKVAGLEFDNDTRVVIRHGARAEFGRLLSDSQISKLAEKQSQMSDFHAEPSWTGTYPVPPGLPPHDPTNVDFITSRKNLARRAVRVVDEDVNVEVGDDSYVVVYDGKVPAWLPRTLFGVKLVTRKLVASEGVA